MTGPRAVVTPAVEWCRQSAEHPSTAPWTWAPHAVRPGCRLDAPPPLLDIRGEGIPGPGFREKIRAEPGGQPPTTLRATPREIPWWRKPTGRLAQGTRQWAVASGVNGRTLRRGTWRFSSARGP